MGKRAEEESNKGSNGNIDKAQEVENNSNAKVITCYTSNNSRQWRPGIFDSFDDLLQTKLSSVACFMNHLE